MTGRPLRAERPLNELMEMYCPVEIHADGTITTHDALVPDYYDDELDGTDWELVSAGYTGQHGYRGPVMHNSEFIGGRMEADFRATPGVYVAVPAGWTAQRRRRPGRRRDLLRGLGRGPAETNGGRTVSLSWEINGNEMNLYPYEVDKRIAELEDLAEQARSDLDLMDDEEREELAALRELREDVQRAVASREAWDSATIVSDDGFTEYARDWANSLADLDVVDSYVNWDEFAANLKQDYATVEFDGSTYYVR